MGQKEDKGKDKEGSTRKFILKKMKKLKAKSSSKLKKKFQDRMKKWV